MSADGSDGPPVAGVDRSPWTPPGSDARRAPGSRLRWPRTLCLRAPLAGAPGHERCIWTGTLFHVSQKPATFGQAVNCPRGTRNGSLDAAVASSGLKVWGVASGNVGTALGTALGTGPAAHVPEPGALSSSLPAVGAAVAAGRRRGTA